MSDLRKYYEKYISDNDLDYMYIKHSSRFVYYIEEVARLGDRTINIHINHLRESAIYFNTQGKIKTYSSMDNYLNAIKAFFVYLKRKGEVDNIFNEISDYQDFKDDLFNSCILRQTIERGYIETDTILDLFDYFNNYQSKYLHMKMMGLFFKITLLAPAKRKVIAKLKRSDFSPKFDSVKVNGIEIRLPRALRNDILSAINELNREIDDDELFFSLFYSAKYSDNVFNTPFYYALKDIGYDVSKNKTSFSVEEIQNTGIVNMIKNGTNIQLVSRISGITKSTLIKKLEQFGIPNYDDNVSELYNKEISKVSYYQEL